MKAKYQKGGRKAERVQNRKDAKANRKKFKKFGTPLNKKSINSFRQKGGFSSAGIGTSYEREKRFENREKQKPDLNPPQYYEYKDGKKTIRYKDGDTYTQPPAGTTYKINRGDNTESSEMPVDRRKGGKRYQKGGKKVKSSLQYKPGFPATGNKPSPYNLKTLQKAINRDSTKVADRGMIGDFFDPGVTSGSTGPSDQYNLQINREFRDKETGSSSEQTAKKINTMKNKKQKGGDLDFRKQWSQVRNKTAVKGKKAGPKGPRTIVTAKGSKNNDKGVGLFAQTTTGTSTFTKKRRDGTVKKTITNKTTRTPRKGRSDAKTDTTTKTKYRKDGSVKKSVTRPGLNKKAPGSRMASSKMQMYNKGDKEKFQKGGYMEPSKEVKFGGPTKKMQKGGLTQGKGKVSTSGKSRKRNPNERTPVDPRPSDEMTFLPPGTRGKKQKGGKYGKKFDRLGKKMQTLENKQIDNFDNKKKFDRLGSRRTKVIKKRRDIKAKKNSSSAMQKGGLKTPTANQKGLKKLPTSVRNKMGFKMMGGKMKYGMGGKKNKKFLGGLAGAIGGAKGGGGVGGALKGALGGGIAGRLAGAIGGLKDGGGLKGAMQGFAGGAFGNSNPMGGGGAGGAAGGGVQQAAADPAAVAAKQEATIPGAMKRGGLKDRRKAAKKRMKKSKASAKRSAKKINSKNAVS